MVAPTFVAKWAPGRLLRRLHRTLSCPLALRFPACAVLLPTAPHLRVLHYPAPQRANEYWVLLPGINDAAEDYEIHSFIRSARTSGIRAHMAAVDAHFGYYARRTVLERLREDVVLPARAQGYEHIWLVGVSMGGLGATAYASTYPNEVTGLMLLAPFLGSAPILQEIAEAGGLSHWQPVASENDIAPSQAQRTPEYQREIWRWLKGNASRERGLPALYLAYGENDFLVEGNQLLAEALPRERVFTVPGRHDWATWKRLWNLLLAARCPRGSGMP